MGVIHFPGAIEVSVSTASITTSQMLPSYDGLRQGLPSNALDYQSPSAPYGLACGGQAGQD